MSRSEADLKRAVGNCFIVSPAFCSIEDWDVSNVKDMSGMFEGATLFNGDISKWRVSKVENMKDMFRNARSFKQKLTGSSWFNSGAVKTDMFQGSFGGISRTLIMSNNDHATSKQISTTSPPPNFMILSKKHLESEVFFCLRRSAEGNCPSHPQGAIGTWDVSRVTDMSGLFSGANLFNADISKWDVSRVTNMNRMFMGAKSFECDLSKWDVSRVTDMSQMFSGAKSFKGDALKWKVSTQSPEKVRPTHLSHHSSNLLMSPCRIFSVELCTQARTRLHSSHGAYERESVVLIHMRVSG